MKWFLLLMWRGEITSVGFVITLIELFAHVVRDERATTAVAATL